MRRLNKSKKGFTLVELVLVITIIVILAGVTALSVGDILAKAKAANTSVSENASTARHNISLSESKLASYGF